jgi:hypothetical protein
MAFVIRRYESSDLDPIVGVYPALTGEAVKPFNLASAGSLIDRDLG